MTARPPLHGPVTNTQLASSLIATINRLMKDEADHRRASITEQMRRMADAIDNQK